MTIRDLISLIRNIIFYSTPNLVNCCTLMCVRACLRAGATSGPHPKRGVYIQTSFYHWGGCLYIYLSYISFTRVYPRYSWADHVGLHTAAGRLPLWLTLHLASRKDTECKAYSGMIWGLDSCDVGKGSGGVKSSSEG